jgi:hypothetical protein
MPYLIGPNSEPMTPKPNSATNRIATGTSQSWRRRASRPHFWLQTLSPGRLVVPVGHRRQTPIERVGDNEYCRRQRNERLARGAAYFEQNQEDQRVFEEVVTECRKELAPKQWCKTA